MCVRICKYRSRSVKTASSLLLKAKDDHHSNDHRQSNSDGCGSDCELQKTEAQKKSQSANKIDS